jgi:multidrug efflux pump subunit AcrA (membrane-fusion protein)
MKRILIGCAIVVSMVGCDKKQEVSNKERADIPIKVKTEKVETVQGISNLKYSGTIEAFQTIPLSFRSTGTVQNVMVQEGDAVKKGQLLAIVDESDMQNMYDASLASFQQEKAKSQLEITKNSLEKCKMYAPSNGIIGRRNVEPGQSSISGLTPLELVKIEKVLVKISVPENEIGKIKKGLKASISISALGNKKYEGIVSHVGVVADRFSRTYTVKMTVDNPNLEMKPGMVCDVTLDTNTENELVVVPYTSISKDTDGNTFIYKLLQGENRVKKQIITIGKYQAEGLVVLSGLTANETIVVEGKEKLSDNCQISL